MENGTYLLIFTIVLTFSFSDGQLLKLKTFGEEKSFESCKKEILEEEHDLTVQTCNKDNEDNEGYEVCVADDGEYIYEYRCVNHEWKLTSGTGDHHSRQKRFIQLIAYGFKLLARISTAIYCSLSGKCYQTEEEIYKHPPKFTFCPGKDDITIGSSYQSTSASVKWKEPKADKGEVTKISDHTNGKKFEGESSGLGKKYSVTYDAKDENGLTGRCRFTFYVKYIKCDSRDPPEHGTIECSHGSLHGSKCNMKCKNGYKLKDNNAPAVCLKSGKWNDSNIKHTCQKIECSSPFKLENGDVECESENYLFESICNFKCDSGFGLVGPPRMECEANGRWSVKPSSVKCRDTESPAIKCKSPQIVYADRGGKSASVHWTEPSAVDNTDLNPIIRKLTDISQGDILMENDYHIKYSANDSAGNSDVYRSICTITLKVEVVKCTRSPTDTLRNSRFIMFNCSDIVYYNGVECDLSCDLNLPLNGSSKMSCERIGASGNGKWMYDSGEQPFCEVITCPTLDPPDNGAFTTDNVNARPLHVMLCKEGYDIPAGLDARFHGRLSCQDSGKWYPLSAFPDCIKSVLPILRLPAKLIYKGKCDDNSTKEAIKHKVLEYLADVKADVDKSICADTASDDCKIENINVVCGQTSRRRRRTDRGHRTQKRADDYVEVTFDIAIVFNTANTTAEKAYLASLEKIVEIKGLFQNYINDRKLDIENLTTVNDTFQSNSDPEFTCKHAGYIFDASSLKCKQCPKGTYLNSTLNICEFCGYGLYSDHEAAASCKECPYGFSTLKKGSKDKTACLELCSPGYVSSTTMIPCIACPVGTYQPYQGQKICLSCPAGYATNGTNSISKSDCGLFDFFVGTLKKETLFGTFVTSGSHILMLSTWVRALQPDNKRFSIKISDTFGGIINITFTDYLKVGFLGRLFHLEGTLTVDWTHIVCTINLLSGNVTLYLGKKTLISETAISINRLKSISEGTIEIENLSEGVYISGFQLFTNEMVETEEVSFMSSCLVPRDDGVFSLTDMIAYSVQGSAIILPSTCDPINECETGVCGIHTCINKVNGFECVCKDGMTGDLCDIPPDFCQDNECVNGDCVPLNGTYTCNCSNVYTGPFCKEPPVNGGWSDWEEWNACSTSCGGGMKTRKRKCNNPLPGFMGSDCEGNRTEIQSCNKDVCQTCPIVKVPNGTNFICVENSKGNMECKMTCITGKILANGQKPFEKYTCGPETGYSWVPTNKLPQCVDITVPKTLGIRMSVGYKNFVPRSKVDGVTSAVRKNFESSLKCKSCQIKSTITTSNLSKRSVSGDVLSLQISSELKETGDIKLQEYLANGTETPAMSDLIRTLKNLNEIVEFMQTNSTSIFDVTVDGVEYSSSNDSLSFAGVVTCPDGNAGANGVCAKCPPGTKMSFPDCISCEMGTYQPLQAQNYCLPCPDGSTTLTMGASDISECSVIETIKETTTEETEVIKEDDGSAVVVAVAVVASLFCIAIIAVVAFFLWKRNTRTFASRGGDTADLTQYSMIETNTNISD